MLIPRPLLIMCAALPLGLACGGGLSSSTPSAKLPVISSFAAQWPGNDLHDGNKLIWTVSNATSLKIDQGIGPVTGTEVAITPTAVGTVEYTLTATNADGSSTAKAKVVTWPPAVGLSADRPPFLTQSHGGFKQAWAGGGYWPEQLFWQDVAFYRDHWNDAIVDADGIESAGTPPTIGCVAWGFDLICANGGDASQGFADFSQRDGFKQFAAWMNPRAGDYFALNEQGQVAYPGEGYISFGMPMLEADAEFPGQTFGQWAGKRMGNLALDLHCRGLSGADGFIGLDYFTDWHPRLISAFEQWSGITVQGATTADQHTWIMNNCPSQWWDFQAHNQSSFFATFGQTLLAAGKTPRVGGQYPNLPAIARLFGDDPRIWAQHLDPKDLLFFVENQSAGDRNTPPQWTSLSSVGSTACRSPEVPIGGYLDADIQDYWGAVSRAGLSHEDGLKYLKHTWLATAWTHIANADGSVRRAVQVLVRSFWDAGGVDPDVVQAYLTHIPKHPFGPALYYSTAIERSFEAPPPPNTDTPNYYFQHWYLLENLATPTATSSVHTGQTQGLNVGYWVSDAADVTKLASADKPSAWIVYNLERLPDAEKAALQAIAPVLDPHVDPAAVLAAGPIRVTGSGLNCVAFVDQNGSVIVMISNLNNTETTGTMAFTNVGDGTFACNGLLGTPSASLAIANHQGGVPINVPGRDTIVFEIPGLTWIGH